MVAGKSHVLRMLVGRLRRHWDAEWAELTVNWKHCCIASSRVHNKRVSVIAPEATEEGLVDKEQFVDGKLFSE